VDWCGTESLEPASFCKSGVHNIRYKCQNCGRVAINPVSALDIIKSRELRTIAEEVSEKLKRVIEKASG